MKCKVFTQERGKVRVDLVPPIGIREEAVALDHGNQKEGRTPFNWRHTKVLASDQAGGALRHLLAYLDGEDFETVIDVKTGRKVRISHLGAVRARCNILLDAERVRMLIDDRGGKKPRRR